MSSTRKNKEVNFDPASKNRAMYQIPDQLKRLRPQKKTNLSLQFQTLVLFLLFERAFNQETELSPNTTIAATNDESDMTKAEVVSILVFSTVGGLALIGLVACLAIDQLVNHDESNISKACKAIKRSFSSEVPQANLPVQPPALRSHLSRQLAPPPLPQYADYTNEYAKGFANKKSISNQIKALEMNEEEKKLFEEKTKKYICIIRQDLPDIPVRLQDGIYDFDALKEWVKVKKTCPATRQPFDLKEIVPARDVLEEIAAAIKFIEDERKKINNSNANPDKFEITNSKKVNVSTVKKIFNRTPAEEKQEIPVNRINHSPV